MDYKIVAQTTTPRVNDVLRSGHSAITYSIIREGSSPVTGFSTVESAERAVARMRVEFEEMLSYMNRHR